MTAPNHDLWNAFDNVPSWFSPPLGRPVHALTHNKLSIQLSSQCNKSRRALKLPHQTLLAQPPPAPISHLTPSVTRPHIEYHLPWGLLRPPDPPFRHRRRLSPLLCLHSGADTGMKFRGGGGFSFLFKWRALSMILELKFTTRFYNDRWDSAPPHLHTPIFASTACIVCMQLDCKTVAGRSDSYFAQNLTGSKKKLGLFE